MSDIEFVEFKDLQVPQRQLVKSNPIGLHHVINLNREITSSVEFAEELDVIRNAGEQDIIHIYFSCNGGDLSTTIEIANALSQTPAHIVCELTSHAYSGGSMLFMLGDEFIINANTSMMIHTAEYGVSGNEPTVISEVNFFNKQIKKIINDFYQDFLLESEISKVLDGLTLWFDAEEIYERIELMMEDRKERAMESLDGENNV